MSATQASDKLSVTVNGTDYTLFMSYSVLNRLTRLAGNLEDFNGMFVDPEVQEQVVFECVKRKCKPADAKMADLSLEDFEIGVEDADKIVTWAGDHVVDFFLKAFNNAQNASKRMEPLAQNLMSSLDGTETSTSKTPSAGPSEPSPQS